MSGNVAYAVVTPDITTLLSTAKECTKSWLPGKAIMFACPSQGCPRSAGSERKQFFKGFYKLKMHYLTVHGERKYECSLCDRRFGNEVVFKHHQSQCNDQAHECSCGKTYKSRNALVTHTRRKHGVFADHIEVKKPSAVIAVPIVTSIQNEAAKTSGTSPIESSLNQDRQKRSIKNFPLSPIIPRMIRILPNSTGTSAMTVSKSNEQSHYIHSNKYLTNDARDMLVKAHLTTACDEFEVMSENDTDDLPCSLNAREERAQCDKIHIPGGKRKIEEDDSTLMAPCNQRKLATLTAKNCVDVFDEISTSPKKLAHMCTQTSLSFGDLGTRMTLPHNIDNTTNYTQVNNLDFHERTSLKVSTDTQTDTVKKSTMDTHTQINFCCKDERKRTTDMHTQISSDDVEQFPLMLTTDTQTQINTLNFKGILRKLSMDTQTEINSNNFTFPSSKSMESTDTQTDRITDTQTQINTLNFKGILRKLSMDTQTEINSNNFTFPSSKSMESTDTQTDRSWMNNTALSHLTNLDPEFCSPHDESKEDQTPDHKLSPETTAMDSLSDDLFILNDSGTQTDNLNPWLNEVPYLEVTTMGTQTTSCPDKLCTRYGGPLLSDKSIQLDNTASSCNTRDQSIQLENMISLDDTCNIVLTESTNTSTQTISTERDDWLTANLMCESSSTQTDFFENLDFMDVDFQISSDVVENVRVKSHIETQTTIALSDMLESPLERDYCTKTVNKGCHVGLLTQTPSIGDGATQTVWE